MSIIKKNLKYLSIDSFAIFIIALIPALLITGPFLPDLLISICALLFFFYLKKDKFAFDKKKKHFTVFFTFFYFFVIVSSLYSLDVESIFKSLAIIRFFLFTLVFWHILEKYELKVLKKLFKICLISTIILIADSFLQFLTGTNILGYGRKEIDSAVKSAISKGNMSTLNCPEEVYLAEELIKMNPWADMVRFARSGGEANANRNVVTLVKS